MCVCARWKKTGKPPPRRATRQSNKNRGRKAETNLRKKNNTNKIIWMSWLAGMPWRLQFCSHSPLAWLGGLLPSPCFQSLPVTQCWQRWPRSVQQRWRYVNAARNNANCYNCKIQAQVQRRPPYRNHVHDHRNVSANRNNFGSRVFLFLLLYF